MEGGVFYIDLNDGILLDTLWFVDMVLFPKVRVALSAGGNYLLVMGRILILIKRDTFFIFVAL